MPTRTKKISIRPPEEPDYNERTALAERQSMKALFRQAGQLWTIVQRDKTKMSDAAVDIVNHAAQLGRVLVQICGGEQLGLSFWQQNCAAQLPFNFDAARGLISVFKKVPEPIKEFSEIWPVWKQVNLALGTLQIPERAGEQTASEISPLTAISHLAGQAVARFQKWTETEPLDTWPRDRLETVAVETKQIHDIHDRVQAILRGKG